MDENHEYDPGNFANECSHCKQAWWSDIHRGEWDGFGADYDEDYDADLAWDDAEFDCTECGGPNPDGNYSMCEFCEEGQEALDD